MKRSGSIASNVVWNVLGYVSSIVVSFVLSPLVIRTLGNSRYGVWTLIGELTGYYGLFDLGIRAAVTYYIASYAAQKRTEELRSTIGSAFWFLLFIGAALAITGVVVVCFVPSMFRVDTVPLRETQWAAIIISITVGLTLPMDVFASVLTGNKRLDLVNTVDIGARVISAGAIVLVMKLGGGLIELSLVQAASKLISWTAAITIAHRLEPNLTISPATANSARMRELMSFGARNVVINLTRIAIMRTDLIVTAAIMGSSAVTFFHLGRMLAEYFFTGVSSISMAFTPHLTQYHAAEEHDRLTVTYLRGTRLVTLVAAPLGAFVVAFAHPFLALWVGPEYVRGAWTMRSDVVLWVLMGSYVARSVQTMSNQVLYATRALDTLVPINVAEAIAKVALSIILGKYFGLAGVAAATTIPLGITNLLVIPRYVLRRVGIPFSQYWRQGIGSPLIGGVCVYAVSAALVAISPPVTWPQFAVVASLAFIAGTTLFAFIATTREDRMELIQRAPEPVRRWLALPTVR